jgi:MarR family transcriptional regulator, organic hydroperoxide resistance regulator
MNAHRDPAAILDFIRRMWAVDHELHRVSKRMVDRIGLTAPQRLAVRFIGQQSGVTLGQLAEVLHLHAGTVTGIVRRLEELQLVVQTRDVEDTRRRHVALTPKGRQIDRRRKGTVEAAVRKTAQMATPQQMAAAAHVMDVLAKNLAAE